MPASTNAESPMNTGRSHHQAAVLSCWCPTPNGHRASRTTKYAVMCHRNSVMITPFRKIVAFQGRGRCSQGVSVGRRSMTAPIDQISASRKQTVGG